MPRSRAAAPCDGAIGPTEVRRNGDRIATTIAVPRPKLVLSDHREPSMKVQHTPSAFVLRFDPLLGVGRAFSFPCDADGRVDLDCLAERARCNYFYARSLIGRDFTMPAVQQAAIQ